MTKNLSLSVQQSISDQMRIISEMAEVVKSLHKEAEDKNDDSLRRAAKALAAQVKALSEEAYSVGEKVIDHAA